MVLSKRERQIFIVTLSVLMIFLLDRFILEPVLDARTQMTSERQELIKKIQKASEIIIAAVLDLRKNPPLKAL